MAIDLVTIVTSVPKGMKAAGCPLSPAQEAVLTGMLAVWAKSLADAVREQDAQKSGWNGCHFTAAEIRAMKGTLP
jgi:Ni,Fe-hydrogenase III small subunit